MGVYVFLWCKDCGVHLHLGKLKADKITREDAGLIYKYLFIHLGHDLKCLTENSEEFELGQIGKEWRY